MIHINLGSESNGLDGIVFPIFTLFITMVGWVWYYYNQKALFTVNDN